MLSILKRKPPAAPPKDASSETLRALADACIAENEKLARDVADFLKLEHRENQAGNIEAAIAAAQSANACAAIAAQNITRAAMLRACADTRRVIESEAEADRIESTDMAACEKELAAAKKAACHWKITSYNAGRSELKTEVDRLRDFARNEKRVLQSMGRWTEDPAAPPSSAAQQEASNLQRHWGLCIARAREIGLLSGIGETSVNVWEA